MITPAFRDNLENNRPVFGYSTQSGDPVFLELMGRGWDFCWVDLQHGTATPADGPHLVRAAESLGLTLLFRIAAGQPALLSWLLDQGAGGVIVAQTERVEQAIAAAEAAKFPPRGNRSFGSRRLIDRHGRNYIERADREQKLILQVESPQAIEQAVSFARVPGVDGLMIGPDDIKMRMGKPMETPLTDPDLWPLATATAQAARSAGKLAMGFAAATWESVERVYRAGFHLLSVGAVTRCVTEGSAALLNGIARWKEQVP